MMTQIKILDTDAESEIDEMYISIIIIIIIFRGLVLIDT